MAVPPPVIIVDSSASELASQKAPPTSSHRLPTQSAAAALEDLSNTLASSISSGLSSLNRGLVWGPPTSDGGYERGKVSEIWGPGGSGKTLLALHAANEAIKTGGRVVWIDCSTPLSGWRLKQIVGHQGVTQASQDSERRLINRFHYISTRSLSQLLAVVLHPPTSFPPSETTLLVIDDVNSIIDLDYARLPFSSNSRTEQQKWQAGRRYAVLGSLVAALNKLANLHSMSVIVTTGCSSRMRREDGLPAAIAPGIGGSEWEAGVWNRIVAFRDFSGRFLGVQKCQGRNITPLDPVGDVRNAIGFEITDDGRLEEHVMDITSSDPDQGPVHPTKPASSPIKIVRKRAFEEIADSEDEDGDDYGWTETDDAAAAADGDLGDGVKATKLNDGAT